MVLIEPEREEGKQPEEPARYEPIISAEEIERAKALSRNIFNDALALLFEPDKRIKPLCQATDLSFTFIVAGIYILLSGLLTPQIVPLPLFPFAKKAPLAWFFASIIYYFAGAFCIYLSVSFLARRDASYVEGLNIIGISFIPLIVASIFGAIFSLIDPILTYYFETAGSFIAILLAYTALREYFDLTIRSAIYLIPLIYTLLYIIVYFFLKVFF